MAPAVLDITLVGFHVLAQFLFSRSETDLDYCHQKVNVQHDS